MMFHTCATLSKELVASKTMANVRQGSSETRRVVINRHVAWIIRGKGMKLQVITKLRSAGGSERRCAGLSGQRERPTP